jgi:hypothetical protein
MLSLREIGLALFVLRVLSDSLTAQTSPLVRWDFHSEETLSLRSHGGVHRDIPGPRPPEYPDFEPSNTAVKLDGDGAYLEFEDPGNASEFDFSNGDSITLEAWVQCDELRKNEFVYIVGKGRTGRPGFESDNQNWALRLRERDGTGCVSFLFATPKKLSSAGDAHWHRWTSKEGFKPGKLWHHVAISYRFGDPESIRCWIDGKSRAGEWDMGGKTTESPIVDNDSIWVGSSRGGAAGNSFRGMLDAVSIHRYSLDDAVMTKRYRTTATEKEVKPAPEIAPDLQAPPGRVALSILEGLPSYTRWLNEDEQFPSETIRLDLDYFLLDRLPQRFDDWGIRSNWKEPVLVRMATDVELPAGEYRVLMRVRGLGRLWFDGKIVARSKPMSGSPSGEEPMTPIAKPPFPGGRIAEHRQQEAIAEINVPLPGRYRLIVEMVVGGKGLRTDPGETLLAIQSAESPEYFVVRASNSEADPLPLRDAEVVQAIQRLEKGLQSYEQFTRRELASSMDAYWSSRHSIAKKIAEERLAKSDVLDVRSGMHSIDRFIEAKIQKGIEASKHVSASEAHRFNENIAPILKNHCNRCHGEKEQGGIRLDSRENLLKAGDSGDSIVVPGEPAQSELYRRVTATDAEERMPPGGEPLKEKQIEQLRNWIASGAPWPNAPIAASQIERPPVIDDSAFLRRVTFDTIGLPPTEEEIREFLADDSRDKRERTIDRLLSDPRWADHWMSYWQDVLAENPTLINASLNTTGPFRWFLLDAFRDDKPVDRWVTELVMMRGSPHEGGSAGFGLAGDNQAPSAQKGQILASAFLGIELQCARCHDSPFHSTKQSDLYSLAALLDQKPVTVPKSSRVPAAFFENKARESLIKVTLNLEQPVAPKWPFEDVCSSDATQGSGVLQNAESSREQLAFMITAPQNLRFAQVIVNRVWRRYMGAGIVEPPHDWEGKKPSHPELLDWLANEFVVHGYSLKHIARRIMTSQTYQRRALGENLAASPEVRFFNAPDPRRLTAEQIVDALMVTSGRPLDVEELTFDPDARRPSSNRLTLGVPNRAWMFANLANERDRPSLNLPRARQIADILIAFGWTGARQNAKTDRETDPNVLQSGILSNSSAAMHFVRLAAASGLADLAVEATSPSQLVERVFLRYLGRYPNGSERDPLVELLTPGFESRVVGSESGSVVSRESSLQRVTWSNHLRPEANEIALELERLATRGPEVDARLHSEWRERFEDALWSVINLREFVWIP